MIGTIALNLIIGIIAFFVTFVTALSGNVFLVSLERAVYAFLLFFLAAFPVRWLIALIVKQGGGAQAQTGEHVDLVTPPDPAETALPKETENEPTESFTPLVIPRVERTALDSDPKKIANVVRQFTDK
jgi:hypothetical protein